MCTRLNKYICLHVILSQRNYKQVYDFISYFFRGERGYLIDVLMSKHCFVDFSLQGRFFQHSNGYHRCFGYNTVQILFTKINTNLLILLWPSNGCTSFPHRCYIPYWSCCSTNINYNLFQGTSYQIFLYLYGLLCVR